MPATRFSPGSVILADPPIALNLDSERYEVMTANGIVLFHDESERTCRQWLAETYFRQVRYPQPDLYLLRQPTTMTDEEVDQLILKLRSMTERIRKDRDPRKCEHRFDENGRCMDCDRASCELF